MRLGIPPQAAYEYGRELQVKSGLAGLTVRHRCSVHTNVESGTQKDTRGPEWFISWLGVAPPLTPPGGPPGVLARPVRMGLRVGG